MAGIVYREGDGAGDSRMVLYAKLCALNKALRSLTYTPEANFNTAIKVPPRARERERARERAREREPGAACCQQGWRRKGSWTPPAFGGRK